MLMIMSDNGRFKAFLDEADDGVSIAIWHDRRGGGWWPLHRDTIDVPIHVACDRITELVNKLQPEISAWPTRSRVLSINGVER